MIVPLVRPPADIVFAFCLRNAGPVLQEPDGRARPIFLQDGPIWASAGVSAGIDLSLALVQEDCGRKVAMQVARQLVIYMKRPGGQSQFSELLQSQTLTSTAFENLHVWISNNLSNERLNVDLLAEHVGM